MNLDSNLLKFQQAGYVADDYIISHPYDYELSTFEINEDIKEALDNIKFTAPYHSSKFTYVDSPTTLEVYYL